MFLILVESYTELDIILKQELGKIRIKLYFQIT